ncbi:GNAT family N-acetyltransferase [Nakamurella leprariae]|uniref:GNAT family N-acetyltransferase n=1 Tax=Nakamurella leprariae TaxID=2803911 RepID=A0A939C0Z9_9ACTN|nr:GNAT family N-acyltransferase [Nakamurella leprariae]MBM9466584.1 GNAT family N-acetyltransferase [Nakamurella leprariae]
MSLAADRSDVVAVQRLRAQVFGAEFGLRSPGGLDTDEFDDRCDHLIVWFERDEPEPGQGPADGVGTAAAPQAVATYRLLPSHSNDAFPLATGLYAHQEFGLAPLESLLDRTVEAGRACVHPDHRGGAAIALLWSGIARYLHLTGHRYLIGCASMPLDDGPSQAAGLWDLVRESHLAPPWRRCRPRHGLPIGGVPRPERTVVPPLLRGYLRLGAWVCGPPAWDREFNTADFLVLLDLTITDRRYLRRFLGDAVEAAVGPAADPVSEGAGPFGTGSPA